MASLGDLVVRLKADNAHFKRGMTGAGAAIKKFGKTAAVAVAAAGAATVTTGLKLIQLASASETMAAQFRVLTGSAEDAARIMSELSAFAATTPFSKVDLGGAAQTLLAFQFKTEELLPILKDLGDVAAGSGAQINDLATILGRATATGKVQGELFNQLIERRVPILEVMSQVTGHAANEILALGSKGKITGAHLREAFAVMAGAGGQFNDGMLQLAETTAGKFSTMMDNFTQLGESLGVELLPLVNKFMESTIELTQQHLPAMVSWMQKGVNAVSFFTTTFTASRHALLDFANTIDGVLPGFAKLIDWQWFVSGFGILGTDASAQRAQSLKDEAAAAKDLRENLSGINEERLERENFTRAAKGLKLLKRPETREESTARSIAAIRANIAANKAAEAKQGIAAEGKGFFGGMAARIAGSKQMIKLQQDLLKAKIAIQAADEKSKIAAEAQRQLDQIRVDDAIAAARDRVNETRPESGGARLAGIATRGSSEAFSSIFASRAAKVPEQALAEHKKANKTLDDLLAEQKKKQTDALLLQGAV